MCKVCRFGRRGFLASAMALCAVPAAGKQRTRPAAHLPLVMIDPGHGGHDPGAIAPDGIMEKTITLASGHALAHKLAATKRYRVAMTRERDVFVTLEGRVADAVDMKADLFLALHCDHLPQPDLRGASVFTLSSTASDKLSANLAQDQNAVDRLGGGAIHGVSPKVADILASLETRATRIGAASFAQDLAESFDGIVPLLPDPKRSANFAVLRDPSSPSVLLEMGCLTNRLDERLLTSPAHRQDMANRITRAIDIYFAGAGRMAG